MGGMSWVHILLIVVIALLLFGPNKLPSLGRSMGEAIRGFKKGLNDDSSETDVNRRLTQNERSYSEQLREEKKDTHRQS